MNKIFLDASAWIEYFLGTEKGKKISVLLEQHPVYTTGVVIAELCGKFVREKQPADGAVAAVRAIAMLLPVDYQVGYAAAHLLPAQRAKQPKFGLADALATASARIVDAQIITCDFDFSGLPNVTIIQ